MRKLLGVVIIRAAKWERGTAQGVVTYAPPVEAFATGIKNFDRRNRPLIA